MGAATYIGRVGVLAVALGVGTALVTGQGIALADDGKSSSSAGSSSKSSDSSSDQTDTASETTKSDTKTTSKTGSSAPDEAAESAAGPTAPGKVSAQTNTGATGSMATESAPDSTEDADAEPEPEPKSSPKTVTPTKNKNDASPTVSIPKARTAAVTAEAAQSAGTESAPNSTVRSALSTSAEEPSAAGTQPTRATATITAATIGPTTIAHPVSAAPAPPNPLDVVTSLVSSVVDWVLGPIAGTSPVAPAQGPLGWTLLAYARREIENFVTAVTDGAVSNPVVAAEATSLVAAAPLDAASAAPFAAAAVVPPRPASPVPGQQISSSTSFVDWVTGNFEPNDTYNRFGIWGTDVGTMWDNGIPDDPTTPIDEHQVLIAFGDTFGGPNMTGTWRLNTLFRSSDINLADGLSVPDGQWLNGNMFGGAPLWGPTYARQIILPERLPPGLPAGVTLIPTAGISVPTPDTQFGATQYISFMSVKQWGAAGQWTTNYSAMAYSTDNGENWYIAPTSVRQNDPWSGNDKFQQSALVRPGDGYVYAYGTPNGRQGAAYLSRVPEQDILDVSQYEYYSSGSAGGWFGIGAKPAGWYKNDPAAATAVFGNDKGACGVAKAGNQVSEMSVQYNKQLDKYVVLYGDQFNNIVIRTSDTPEGTWSSATVLMPQQPGGIYAPMMHPWSPSTLGTGNDLYWNLSLWSEYNVMLMKTDLTKI